MKNPSDNLDSWDRTCDVLCDKDLMAQLERSRQKHVKSRDFEEVAEDLGI